MDQPHARYVEALCAYSQVVRATFHTEGHLQSKGAYPALRVALGEQDPKLDRFQVVCE